VRRDNRGGRAMPSLLGIGAPGHAARRRVLPRTGGALIVAREDLERHGYGSRKPARPVRVLLLMGAMTAVAVAFAGGRLAAHEPLSTTEEGNGGPGTSAVIVDIGPAPGHVLGVSNSGGEVEVVDMAGLVQAVRERLPGADDRRPWVRGHRDATYDAVLKVMGLLSAAGMRVSVFIDREIWDRAEARANHARRRGNPGDGTMRVFPGMKNTVSLEAGA